MGKKVNPKIIRIGVTGTWPSKWFAMGKKYVDNLKEDVQLRRFLLKKLLEAGIDKVEMERDANKININIHTAKPGVVIGRGGSGIDDLKKEIHKKFLKKFRLNDINVNILEVDRPNLSAQIVLQSIIVDIEKRIPFRRVMKQAIGRVEKSGALGVKVRVSGRLNGVDIARSEKLISGKIPLHTLRADISYARGAANTTYGVIGVKVWIYRGDIFKKDKMSIKGEVLGKIIK